MLKWLCNNYIKNEGTDIRRMLQEQPLTHSHTHTHFLRYTTPFQKIVYQWELTILIQIRVPQFSSTKRQLKFSTLKIFWRKRNLENIPLWWKVSLCIIKHIAYTFHYVWMTSHCRYSSEVVLLSPPWDWCFHTLPFQKGPGFFF